MPFELFSIRLRSVIWIGLVLGQHLVHHCDWVGLGHRVDGLNWIGPTSNSEGNFSGKGDPSKLLLRIKIILWKRYVFWHGSEMSQTERRINRRTESQQHILCLYAMCRAVKTATSLQMLFLFCTERRFCHDFYRITTRYNLLCNTFYLMLTFRHVFESVCNYSITVILVEFLPLSLDKLKYKQNKTCSVDDASGFDYCTSAAQS